MAPPMRSRGTALVHGEGYRRMTPLIAEKAATGFWQSRRIVVTGGAGFLGSYVLAHLRDVGCHQVFVPRSRDYDLVDGADVRRLLEDASPHIVIHLAARVGGIGANQASPGTFFYENLMMGVQLMEEARRRGVEKFVAVGTVCAYPKHTRVPFREKDLWDGTETRRTPMPRTAWRRRCFSSRLEPTASSSGSTPSV
jgi:nucleoside-diphosphate-sugar epimerase